MLQDQIDVLNARRAQRSLCRCRRRGDTDVDQHAFPVCHDRRFVTMRFEAGSICCSSAEAVALSGQEIDWRWVPINKGRLTGRR